MYLKKLSQYCDTKSKYFLWYSNLINKNYHTNDFVNSIRKQKLKLNDNIIYEAHHILPGCICTQEENKDIRNIVFLTLREHYIAHMILRKAIIYKPLQEKMNNAFYFMSNKLKFTSSIIYKKSKISAIAKNKKILKGKPSVLKNKTYEEVFGEEIAKKLKKEKSIFFKNRKFSEITLQKMKDNHADFSGAKNPRALKGSLIDNNEKEIFEFKTLIELSEYCKSIGLPFRGLKSNKWIYTPNITARNKQFKKFLGFSVIFVD